MTAKSAKKIISKETSKEPKPKEATFKCRICGKSKPFSDMVVITRFYPPLTACKACAVKMDYAHEEEESQEV